MSEQTVNVAVLGAGTVGSQVVRLLAERGAELSAKAGGTLRVSRVLVRDISAVRDYDIDPQLLTTDPGEALAGADIVIELIGGIEPAFTLVKRAIAQGSSVITGNKALLALHGPHLYELAGANDVDLYYEAAVAGAVPIVYGLRESMAGDQLNRILGIVNGTTNYILDQMATTGVSYDQALADAQRLGYAEADPSADVDGLDAAAKCALMASLGFHTRVAMGDVLAEGITNVSERDMYWAKRAGMTIKLLALAERRTGEGAGEGLHLEVFPALVPTTHPLASVSGAFNAVIVEGESAGRLMFYGQGAGGAPTASAVLSDLVAAAHHRCHGGRAPRESTFASLPITPAGEVASRYQLRLSVRDQAGALHEITEVFARRHVSILSLHQEAGADGLVEIALTTHAAPAAEVAEMAGELADLPAVEAVLSRLRILDY